MPRRLLTALIAAGLCLAAACSDGAPTSAAPDSSTSAPTSTTTAGAPVDHLLIEASDLPAGFEPSGSVDDTITAFCAGEDAAAGLQASSRAVGGFQRTGGGASVVQLAFRFRDDDATTFVAQAAAALDRCDSVPDLSGLAFEYQPLAPELEAVLAEGTDGHTGRYGTSVGSGKLTIDVAVVRHGEVGELIAVLGVDLPRPDLDALAAPAFSAVVARLRDATP
jgi:hypothetical protein